MKEDNIDITCKYVQRKTKEEVVFYHFLCKAIMLY